MDKNLWTYEAFDEYELEDLTKEVIKDTEKILGHTLPDAYLDLVKEQNGGRLHLNVFRNEHVEDGFVAMEWLYGICTKASEGILQTGYLIKEWDLPNHIVILYNNGHQFIFLDYRESKDTPTVSFVDTELDLDLVLAKSFHAFISDLEHSHKGEGVGALRIENEYTPIQLETEILKGDDAFAITDGFYYFSEMGADPTWLLNQGIKLCEHEDEFIVQESLGYLLRLVANSPVDKRNTELINKLINKLEYRWEPGIQKYAHKFSKIIASEV